MALPVSSNNSRTKATGWVHARSGEVYSSKMSESYGETNGERSSRFSVGFVWIAHPEYCQDKNEAQEYFYSKSLQFGQLSVDLCVAKTCLVNFFWSDSLKKYRENIGYCLKKVLM